MRNPDQEMLAWITARQTIANHMTRPSWRPRYSKVDPQMPDSCLSLDQLTRAMPELAQINRTRLGIVARVERRREIEKLPPPNDPVRNITEERARDARWVDQHCNRRSGGVGVAGGR